MTYARSGDINKLYPKRKDVEGRWLCRWCGKRLKGRRTSWCCKEHADEVFIRCWPVTAKWAVWERDGGVCARCGLDTERLQERISRIRRRFGHDIFSQVLLKYAKRGFPFTLSRSWWEADHIIPVSEGGGNCGLEGYQTLCLPCHKKETASLRKRLAKQRLAQQRKPHSA
ncbi:MAG: HNH endonuclease [Dehalococcoidales bacterium]